MYRNIEERITLTLTFLMLFPLYYVAFRWLFHAGQYAAVLAYIQATVANLGIYVSLDR